MTILITRNDKTITATAGPISRSHDCGTIRSAVALETKLAGDPAFATWWVREGDSKMPELMPHGLGRPTAPAIRPDPTALAKRPGGNRGGLSGSGA